MVTFGFCVVFFGDLMSQGINISPIEDSICNCEIIICRAKGVLSSASLNIAVILRFVLIDIDKPLLSAPRFLAKCNPCAIFTRLVVVGRGRLLIVIENGSSTSINGFVKLGIPTRLSLVKGLPCLIIFCQRSSYSSRTFF